jgi:hypothetical protein
MRTPNRIRLRFSSGGKIFSSKSIEWLWDSACYLLRVEAAVSPGVEQSLKGTTHPRLLLNLSISSAVPLLSYLSLCVQERFKFHLTYEAHVGSERVLFHGWFQIT